MSFPDTIICWYCNQPTCDFAPMNPITWLSNYWYTMNDRSCRQCNVSYLIFTENESFVRFIIIPLQNDAYISMETLSGCTVIKNKILNIAKLPNSLTIPLAQIKEKANLYLIFS